MKMNKKINLFVLLIISSLTLMIVMNPETPLVSAGPRPYYGEVTFTGTISLNYSDDAVSNVYVELLEDGSPKDTDYTDGNGDYELEWDVQRFKFYSLRISKSGYNTDSQFIIPTSANHEEDRTLYGRVALFFWASEVANITMIEEYGDYLVDDEGFTGILYREDNVDWEDSIDDLDDLETYYSLVFIHIYCHGDTTGGVDYPPGDTIAYNRGENENTYILSSAFADKIECLESNNIIVLVDTCNSGDFVDEYIKPERDDEPVFVMSSANFEHPEYYPAAMWFGDTKQWFDEQEDYLGSWGGAFSHYFFERLADGEDNISANYYASGDTSTYAYTYFDELIQEPQCYDNLVTTWFG
ncbi:MAG: hypothetical protein ACTSVO_15265 [Candidatus Heimdallarchaeaceae archaeon]